jgi:hypothetical protein
MSSNIQATLVQRGNRYGEFAEHANITQRLKLNMQNTPNWHKLPANMKESLEMVAHKIGRILNGDPTYDDSWVDIAGYATLVANDLQRAPLDVNANRT